MVKSYSFSQNKDMGMGKFILNKTVISVVDEVAKELKCEIIEIDSFTKYIKSSKDFPGIYEIIYNSDTKNLSAKSCPDTKVYYINKYDISGIEVKEMYLIFYKGILVHIKANGNPELAEALTIKYGKPVSKLTENEVTCTSLYGGSQKLKENRILSTWGKDHRYSCSEYLSKTYDSKCKANYFDVINIFDSEAYNIIDLCERDLSNKKKEKDLEIKKEKLKDF